MEYERLKQNAYKALKTTVVTTLILANLYGVGEHINGAVTNNDTTGHVSSDIFLGRREPTGLQKAIMDFLE
ncbi:MAG: hypothetical protein KKH88_02150 [Nanoarchaeota archaeon]|nr:hypothetical protein [Nanoarchaeota archaeon]MBU1445443.1 hypothetical protein [Nanoarchaeota archaeon]MBU2420251.1 hypothetical protein [Nanoarchaeota archaeon]MBU2474986.1 hypothetical protein [Nanoarchaeota archaeon]MBU3940709.1 hypothetical protein [Nanoarchaeota archaeon]